MTLTSTVRRGLIAGAAGTTFLNAITYTDMAVRGRDSSDTPERAVEALTEVIGAEIPGRGKERDNRLTAIGALLGTATGLAAGVAGAGVRALGVRLPFPFDAALVGGAAMAATDGSLAVLGVSDPRNWTTSDWVSDTLPHLGFGVATVATLRSLEKHEAPPRRAGVGLLTRSALLGVASGSRSSLGLAAPTLVGSGAGLPARAGALLAVSGEFRGDRSPAAPPRTSATALPPRFASAVAGATALARRENANAAGPVIAGAMGAAVGAFGGLALREWGIGRFGDRRAALAEDAAAVTLAFLAARPSRRR
jgi:uncharacterized membrane protein